MSKTTIIFNTKTLDGENIASKYDFTSKIRLYIASGIDDFLNPLKYSLTIETAEQHFVNFILDLFATKKINDMSDVHSVECIDYESKKKILIPSSLIKTIKLNQFVDSQLINPINFTVDMTAENGFASFEDIV